MLRLKPPGRRPAKPSMDKAAAGGRLDLDRMKGPLRTALRLALAVLLFFWILDIWNVDLPIGEAVVRTLIKILVVVLICYVAWGLINAAILRRMRQEMPEAEADDEKEEGGAGGSRIAHPAAAAAQVHAGGHHRHGRSDCFIGPGGRTSAR